MKKGLWLIVLVLGLGTAGFASPEGAFDEESLVGLDPAGGLYHHIARIKQGSPVWLRFHQHIGTLGAGQPYTLTFDLRQSAFTVTGYSATRRTTYTASYVGTRLQAGEIVVWGATFLIDGGGWLYHPASGEIVGQYQFL